MSATAADLLRELRQLHLLDQAQCAPLASVDDVRAPRSNPGGIDMRPAVSIGGSVMA
jgi:hypothetical protein